MKATEQEHIPEISVIMGVYNQYSREELMTAVRSVLDQTFSDFEFIIYNDGSDREPTRHLKDLEQLDPRIRVIHNAENWGLAFSLNRCIREARGKYIARMDADDISLPTRLAEEYEFLETHPAYDWVGCNARVFEGDETWGILIMAEEPNQYNFLPFSPYIHPSVMYRNEIFLQGNRYEETHTTRRCEDYEFFMWLYRNGFRGYNLQRILLLYRQRRDVYKRRKAIDRIREAQVRAKHFPHMDLPVRKVVAYTMRPLIAMLIPYPLIAAYKKRRLKELAHHADEQGTTDL